MINELGLKIERLQNRTAFYNSMDATPDDRIQSYILTQKFIYGKHENGMQITFWEMGHWWSTKECLPILASSPAAQIPQVKEHISFTFPSPQSPRFSHSSQLAVPAISKHLEAEIFKSQQHDKIRKMLVMISKFNIGPRSPNSEK